MFAPLLRVRTASPKTLELQSKEVAGKVWGLMPTNAPSQILKFNPHVLVGILWLLQGLADVETVVGKLYRIFISDHLVLVK